jgi:hypothetical protein
MRSYDPTHSLSESSNNGWVGVADSLVGALVLILVVALAAAGQLNKANSEIAEVQKQNTEYAKRLKEYAKRLKEIETIEANEKAYQEALKAAEKAKKEIAILEAKLKESESQISTLRTKLRDTELELARLSTKVELLNQLMKALNTRDTEALAVINRLLEDSRKLKELGDAPKPEAVHAKLLAIKGNLKKVAIILDFSGSMMDDEKRWTTAKEYITNVCSYLDMEECVLIVFSNDVRFFGFNTKMIDGKPSNPSEETPSMKTVGDSYKSDRPFEPHEEKMLKECGELSNAENDSILRCEPFRLSVKNHRQSLENLVRNLPTPSGGTNTRKALNAAYQIAGLTSILLLTDGQPGILANQFTKEKKEELIKNGIRAKPPDFKLQKQWIFEDINQLAKDSVVPPINVIGIGDYFDNELSSFLRELATKSKGTFQGR